MGLIESEPAWRLPIQNLSPVWRTAQQSVPPRFRLLSFGVSSSGLGVGWWKSHILVFLPEFSPLLRLCPGSASCLASFPGPWQAGRQGTYLPSAQYCPPPHGATPPPTPQGPAPVAIPGVSSALWAARMSSASLGCLGCLGWRRWRRAPSINTPSPKLQAALPGCCLALNPLHFFLFGPCCLALPGAVTEGSGRAAAVLGSLGPAAVCFVHAVFSLFVSASICRITARWKGREGGTVEGEISSPLLRLLAPHLLLPALCSIRSDGALALTQARCAALSSSSSSSSPCSPTRNAIARSTALSAPRGCR